MSKAKFCPFCGGKAVWGAADSNYYVRCGGTDCLIRPTTALLTYYPTKKEAIEAWNKRAEK